LHRYGSTWPGTLQSGGHPTGESVYVPPAGQVGIRCIYFFSPMMSLQHATSFVCLLFSSAQVAIAPSSCFMLAMQAFSGELQHLGCLRVEMTVTPTNSTTAKRRGPKSILQSFHMASIGPSGPYPAHRQNRGCASQARKLKVLENVGSYGILQNIRGLADVKGLWALWWRMLLLTPIAALVGVLGTFVLILASQPPFLRLCSRVCL
jgi:hypothetical protein